MYFLTFHDVMAIHSDQIKRYGGKIGVRDQGLLLSAIAQPCSQFSGRYLHDSLHQQAAAYLYHLCKNHPFIDGNKRVGLASTLVFLDLNGHSINEFEEDELEITTYSVAAGQLTKEDVSAFLSNHRQ